MSSGEYEIITPNILERKASEDFHHILPPKSRQKYLKIYDNFMLWRSEKKINSFSESIFLIYFNELSEKLQSSTLWSIYSMLKTTLQKNHHVELKNYTKLTSLLKKLSIGYKSKKSKVLTATQVENFLRTAPDDRYLATKVALIFGINGACRGSELVNITVEDVKTDMHLQAVTIPNTVSSQERTFLVKGEYLDIVKKYQALRPPDITTNRFFLNYQHGKCTKQVIGRNKFATLPKEIATFLNLKNPENYTEAFFLPSRAGKSVLIFQSNKFWVNNQYRDKLNWACRDKDTRGCLCRVQTTLNGRFIRIKGGHNHEPNFTPHNFDTPTEKPLNDWHAPVKST